MESGRQWRAKDIGLTDRKCAWMPHGFMSVDTKLGAGKAFLRSLCHQNAEWGVDFVKHYCIFGDDLNINEVAIVSEVQCDTVLLPNWITRDDWDSWGDVAAQFNVS
ncbi:hypothetical protein IFM89_002876, partial [Coptis chinensis]